MTQFDNFSGVLTLLNGNLVLDLLPHRFFIEHPRELLLNKMLLKKHVDALSLLGSSQVSLCSAVGIAYFMFEGIGGVTVFSEYVLANRYLHVDHHSLWRLDPRSDFGRHEGAHDPFVLFLNSVALHQVFANPALS